MNTISNERFVAFSYALVLFSSSLFVPLAQTRDEKREVVAEGAVIAYQKGLRCPSCEGARGFGTHVESWIVRIDEWKDDGSKGDRYILVEYWRYDRSLSVKEINSHKLKFNLHERREDGNFDCLDEILVSSEPLVRRPPELSDYKLTKPGKQEVIPPLQSMPCFQVKNLPIVVE